MPANSPAGTQLASTKQVVDIGVRGVPSRCASAATDNRGEPERGSRTSRKTSSEKTVFVQKPSAGIGWSKVYGPCTSPERAYR